MHCRCLRCQQARQSCNDGRADRTVAYARGNSACLRWKESLTGKRGKEKWEKRRRKRESARARARERERERERARERERESRSADEGQSKHAARRSRVRSSKNVLRNLHSEEMDLDTRVCDAGRVENAVRHERLPPGGALKRPRARIHERVSADDDVARVHQQAQLATHGMSARKCSQIPRHVYACSGTRVTDRRGADVKAALFRLAEETGVV